MFMKRNIFSHPWYIAVAALFLGACTFEQDDLFDESASLRINHFSEDLKNRLVTQSSNGNNGWVIQYFVAGTDDETYEGVNLLGSFDASGKVTLAGNHRFLRDGNANKYTESVSFYELLKEEGPIISFNTWNDVLMVLVDPVNPTTGAHDGVGMNGDQNLAFKAYEGNSILFRGERHGAEVRFVPCDRPWNQYYTDVDAFKKKITNTTVTNYYVISGRDTMYLSGLNKGVVTYKERIVEPLESKILTCVFSPDGFRLNHVDTIGVNTFQEFKLSEDQTHLVNENGSVKVSACWDVYVANHSAVWKFDKDLFSAEQNDLFNKIDTEVKKFNKDYSLESLGIGQTTGANKVSGLVLTFYTNAAKTKTNIAGVAFTQSRPASGQLKIEYSAEDKIDKNMGSIAKKAPDVETYARAFAQMLNGTYNVTPNDYFLPTGGDFTAVNGGITFRLK